MFVIKRQPLSFQDIPWLPLLTASMKGLIEKRGCKKNTLLVLPFCWARCGGKANTGL